MKPAEDGNLGPELPAQANYIRQDEVSHDSITRITVAILAALHKQGIFIGDGNGSADDTVKPTFRPFDGLSRMVFAILLDRVMGARK